MSFQDHFSSLAKDYARCRPTHPPALFAALAKLAPGRDLAWDCGTGNGQAAHGLAEHFARVVATDPSEAQLAQAVPHPRITYGRAAETAPMLADRSVDLVAAAQAAHWFDRSLFYPEVRRVLRPGGVLAIFNYGLCRVAPEIDRVLQRLYAETLGPYWPPERRLAENNYRDLDFPFLEIEFRAWSWSVSGHLMSSPAISAPGPPSACIARPREQTRLQAWRPNWRPCGEPGGVE